MAERGGDRRTDLCPWHRGAGVVLRLAARSHHPSPGGPSSSPGEGYVCSVTSPTIAAVAISRRGITLSYAASGGCKPTLVFLPGPTDSWRSYYPVFERLSPSVGALAVSQRGHGDSDKPQTGYRVEDFAGDVVPLFDALASNSPFWADTLLPLSSPAGSLSTTRTASLDSSSNHLPRR